ncbi:hypothetical protein SETIT_2G166500v2 [Setaria italica]|uniref:Uncharacterized protein n=1 Tax=Setaria italica TaxID=4555 RepID=A0A368Q009_SETIT|nr:hypothetical protein SETIT_2G166500v2 [Setaria italica]
MAPLQVERKTKKERIMEELAAARRKEVDKIAEAIKDPSSQAVKSDARLSPSLTSFNKAFGTNVRREVIVAGAPGSGEGYNPLNLRLPWMDRFERVGRDTCAAVGGSTESGRSEVKEKGKADLDCTITGAEAKERVEAEAKDLLGRAERVLLLEAKVGDLTEENKGLSNLNGKLMILNEELTRHKNVLLKNFEEAAKAKENLISEREELHNEIEKLRRDQVDNVGIIEKLRQNIEKDIATVRSKRKE